MNFIIKDLTIYKCNFIELLGIDDKVGQLASVSIVSSDIDTLIEIVYGYIFNGIIYDTVYVPIFSVFNTAKYYLLKKLEQEKQEYDKLTDNYHNAVFNLMNQHITFNELKDIDQLQLHNVCNCLDDSLGKVRNSIEYIIENIKKEKYYV
jgi:hypothetical protein